MYQHECTRARAFRPVGGVWHWPAAPSGGGGATAVGVRWSRCVCGTVDVKSSHRTSVSVACACIVQCWHGVCE